MKWTPPVLLKNSLSCSDGRLEYPGWEWAEPAMLKSMGSIHWLRKLWLSPNTVPGSIIISDTTPSICLCMHRNSSGYVERAASLKASMKSMSTA